MKLNHAIIAIAANKEDSNSVEIVHACFYEEKPNEHDWAALKHELQYDPTHDLVGRDDYVLIEAPEEVLQVYWDELGKEITE